MSLTVEQCVRHAICLTVLFALSSARPVAADVFSDVVGFWNFDDGTASDFSGRGNDGVVDPALSFSADTPFGSGQALSLAGTGAVQVPHSDSLAFANGTMTLSMWMKATAAQAGPWGGTIAKTADGVGWETQQFDLDPRIDLRIDTSDSENILLGPVDPAYNDQWVHVAWTVDNGESAGFLNGERVGDFTYAHGDGFSNLADLLIGSRTGFGTVNGLLDEVGLWDTVLTDEEIAFLADSPLAFGVPGDVDGSGETDSVDFGIMQNNFGAQGADVFSLGDANRNGEVDLLDFRVIKSSQGCVASGDGFVCPADLHPAAQAVPEPTSVALALLGAACGLLAARRRQ